MDSVSYRFIMRIGLRNAGRVEQVHTSLQLLGLDLLYLQKDRP